MYITRNKQKSDGQLMSEPMDTGLFFECIQRPLEQTIKHKFMFDGLGLCRRKLLDIWNDIMEKINDEEADCCRECIVEKLNDEEADSCC
jgi:hypothetical protein